MSSSIFVSPFTDAKSRSYLYSIFVGASLVCFVYFTGSALVTKDYHERTSKWSMQILGTTQEPKPEFCKNQHRPPGSEALPEGIVSHTSNLEMRPLWDFSMGKEKLTPTLNLLAIAVGVKQRMIVNKTVEKFLSSGFVVMLFHYDGIVDEWSDLEWYDHVIHVSAKNQTKWWFSKRFLQPDVIAEYDYVFLWDEDLDVENFHPQRYIDIVRSEGLEISQPALDPTKSVVHHPLTARQKNAGVHSWVEMMAPVFSKAAWRCVWYMIQNDLIHA